MTTAYKFGGPLRERLITLEEPGKPLLFDADRRLVEEVSAKWNVQAVVKNLKGTDEQGARAYFENVGKELMKLAMQLADGKYLDRTGQMVEKVAKQTGVSFPHRFERYVELFLLASRPLDRWNIAKATTKELVFQVSGCTVHKAMLEQGLDYKGLPCKEMCLAGFQVAAQQTGDSLKIEMEKALPQDGMCQFLFAL